jgi:hypothetical protein
MTELKTYKIKGSITVTVQVKNEQEAIDHFLDEHGSLFDNIEVVEN